MTTKGLAAVVAALLLAGCSNGADKEAGKPTPTVSLQTTCDRLFVQDDPRLWSQATSLVATHSQGGTVDDTEADTVHDELTKIADSAKPVIKPHIETMADTVGDLDAADNSAYKTAATEVANQCAPYAALG